MIMFARRFKRFMWSNKGRKFQKKDGVKIESTKEKDPINAMNARSRDTSILIVLNGRKEG
ncbi:hypothetical protein J1N35_041442 [Gossypium stocksii]|uniref:Uncharacterized protein n=1 Tax=Gossypium stocksii TaxID=47602 RepID=A0A9D3UFZ4_9ROSI|nr:hypothetical protein J1N35_041442 [Gossypium stocksii]